MDRSLHCICLSSQQGLVARDLLNFKRFHPNSRCRFELLAIFKEGRASKHGTNFIILFYMIEINLHEKKTKLGPQKIKFVELPCFFCPYIIFVD